MTTTTAVAPIGPTLPGERDATPRSRLAIAASGAAILLGIAMVAAVPAAAHLSWHEVAGVLGQVSLSALVGLTALWVLGLWVHTFVLTAALPGLGRRRALLLNLAGSAVSNLVPFGGAAGMGLGYAMARTWGFTPGAFACFTTISNLWNLLAKLAVGSAVVLVAVAAGTHLPPALQNTVVYVAPAVLGFCALVGWMILRPARGSGLGARFDSLRATTREAIGAGWLQLTGGVLAYMFLQAALLAACMHVVGSSASWMLIATAFGVERLLSVVPFTPGGAGVAEIGTVALLVGAGADPVSAASGVLLYRTFTFLLEIPVGGISLGLWLALRRRRGVRAVGA